MEPDLKDEGEVAPLRERLLRSVESDEHSLRAPSKLFLNPSLAKSFERGDKSETGSPSEQKVQPAVHSSPTTDAGEKDTSMTSLFDSSIDDGLEANEDSPKEKDFWGTGRISPVFDSTHRSPVLVSFPLGVSKVSASLGVSDSKENHVREKIAVALNGEAKHSNRDVSSPVRLDAENGDLNFSSGNKSKRSKAETGKDSNVSVDQRNQMTGSERRGEGGLHTSSKSKRRMEDGDEAGLSASKQKYHRPSSSPPSEDGCTTTEKDGGSERKRLKLNFDFRGHSTDGEVHRPSWSRKGKHLLSKNGATKSKVKGAGRRAVEKTTPGVGVDSSGTKSPMRQEIEEDGGGLDVKRDIGISSSPVFDRGGRSFPKTNKTWKHPVPRSFSWEDEIPSICEEREIGKNCDKHRSHDLKDGVRYHMGRNGFRCVSPKHHHRSKRAEKDSIPFGHSLADRGSHSPDRHFPDTRPQSSVLDPRFYPDVDDNRRTRDHHPTDQLKRRAIHHQDRGGERSATTRDADPKTSPRYNKFLPKYQKRRRRERQIFLERSRRTSKPKHGGHDLYPKEYRKSKDKLPSHHRDIPSSPSSEEADPQGNRQETASPLRHPVTGRSRQGDVAGTEPTSRPADSSSVSALLNLSQSGHAQRRRNRSKRRKARWEDRAAVISDDEDDDVVLEGVSSTTSQRVGRVRGEGRHRSDASVTEIINDEDDEIILLGEDELNRTPSRHRASVHSQSEGGDITPRTSAAIQQLEADEAMARRLQLEFDLEEATLARPPPPPPQQQHHEYNAPPEFSHHHLVGDIVRSLTAEFSPESLSGPVSFSFTSQVTPWLDLRHQQSRPRRRGPPRGNRRGQRGHHHPSYGDEDGLDDYERLLELAEHLGPAIPQGLPIEVLTRLPTFKFQGVEGGAQLKEEDRNCAICMSEYEVNEELRRLPCFHAYHSKCIDKWFEQNSACPICRVRVQLD